MPDECRWFVELRHDGQLWLMAPGRHNPDGDWEDLPVQYCDSGDKESREKQRDKWEAELNEPA